MFVLLDYTFSYFLEQETFVSLWLIGVGRGGGIYQRKEMENHAEIVTNSMELKLKFNGNPPKGKKYFKDQNFHLELEVKRLH